MVVMDLSSHPEFFLSLDTIGEKSRPPTVAVEDKQLQKRKSSPSEETVAGEPEELETIQVYLLHFVTLIPKLAGG
jgi:hypothetical protein